MVRIVKASNIAGVYQDGTQSDPFVQLYLLPDKESMKKTKTQKRTLNPIYNKTFIVSTHYIILLYKPQSFYPHLQYWSIKTMATYGYTQLHVCLTFNYDWWLSLISE